MIGIIGIGHIGETLLEGLLSGSNSEDSYGIYDVNEEALKKYQAHSLVNINKNNKDLVQKCHTIFLCIKPGQFDELAKEVKSHLKPDQLIVSVAPDFSISSLQEMFAHKKIIRMMPSTAMKIKRGVIALSKADDVKEIDVQKFQLFMEEMGYLFWTTETGINQTIGVAGSGIAFAYEMIEAMGQGGIRNGLDAKEVYKMAAETLIGAGEMLLKTSEHPAKLRDDVCTPGGLTIKGVNKLEEMGFRHSVVEAVKATYQKEK